MSLFEVNYAFQILHRNYKSELKGICLYYQQLRICLSLCDSIYWLVKLFSVGISYPANLKCLDENQRNMTSSYLILNFKCNLNCVWHHSFYTMISDSNGNCKCKRTDIWYNCTFFLLFQFAFWIGALNVYMGVYRVIII